MGEHKLSRTAKPAAPTTDQRIRFGRGRRWLYKHADLSDEQNARLDLQRVKIDPDGQMKRRNANGGFNATKREMAQEYGSARQRKKALKAAARAERAAAAEQLRADESVPGQRD